MSGPILLAAQPRPRYSSTRLRYALDHCPYALDLYEAGTPYERGQFAVGIAAHAVIQAAAQATNRERRALSDEEIEAAAERATQALIAGPRTFDRSEEPPLHPDHAFEGRELALDWLLGMERPEPGAEIEVGLALDRDGNPADYWSDDAYYSAILDHVAVARRTDEETSARVLTLRDYKTSWQAGDGELQSVQRRGQAVVAWPVYGAGVDVLRLEVVNLRTRRIRSAEYHVEDGLAETLEQWRRDLWTTLEALDQQATRSHRPARPGAGCMRCPFILACDHAQDWLDRGDVPATAEKRAVAYAAALATSDHLAELVRLDCGDGSIPVPGGVVGFVGRERRQANERAHVELSEAWPGADSEAVRGLLKAQGLSVKAIESVAKALWPMRNQKKDREQFIAGCVERIVVAQFGVHPQADEEAHHADSKPA